MRLLMEGFYTLINGGLFSSPTNVGHHNSTSSGGLALRRYKWYQSQTPDDVSAFSLFPEGEKTRDSVPVRTLGPKRRWIWRGSHIDWRKKRVPAMMLGTEGGWAVMSYISWGREQNTLYKGMETF